MGKERCSENFVLRILSCVGRAGFRRLGVAVWMCCKSCSVWAGRPLPGEGPRLLAAEKGNGLLTRVGRS